MDAEMLQVVCDGYNTRIDKLEEQNKQFLCQIEGLVMARLCLSRGGHEYKSIGNCGLRECKFCGWEESK